MNCLFSKRLFDSKRMADDGQDKLQEGHIIMLSRWSYVDSLRFESAAGSGGRQRWPAAVTGSGGRQRWPAGEAGSGRRAVAVGAS